ncbi:hypothetical protein [Treponema bryantii]|uniref:hypothetical protein n=1 Tax=Treponema bryantii TaxID=163 RepID=UPI002B2F9DDB|nr:hypothetical protein TRBR_17450 [Treponema bryantii]
MSNSKEAEFEKSIDVMSTTIAECTVKVKEGVCNKDTCKNCDLHQWLNNCLLQLPDIYKIRIMNDVKEKVALYDAIKEEEEKKKAPKRELTTKEKIGISLYNFKVMNLEPLGEVLSIVFWELLGMIGIPLLVLFLIYSCSSCSLKAYGQSLNDYDYTRYALPGEAGYAGKYRKNILDTLDKTYKYTVDINHDGEINCIDYSCTFKMLWDKSFNSKDCEIVRNKSATMNHLFIRVRQYGGTSWECIEPQAAKKDITKYFMEDFWSAREYNPIYNIYGETDKWLEEFKAY